MEITPELITQYGLMSKISTGNTYLDLVFCLLVPLMLKHLVPVLASLPDKLWPKRTQTKTFTRYIEHTNRSYYYWYDSDNQPPNSILQRAILNLINSQKQTLSELPQADLAIKKKPAAGSAADGGADGAGSEDDEGSGGSNSEHRYSFNLAPPEEEWVDLKNGIKFMRQMSNLDDKNKATKVTYILESDKPDGNKRINDFVTEALEVYRRQQSARHDPARYLYMPVLSGLLPPPASDDEGSSSRPSALYKRYKLSEEKTFSSLFHPDKEQLIKLVDQFLAKTGKFAIPGYPQKLGFLLYGPPGTGKTSLIKALAQYTKRSIISVPLSKISTNQELMDIVFDNKLKIQNSTDSDISLPFDKTIFVMEDVDAASSVVQRRSPPAPGEESAAASAAATRAEVLALADQIANAKLAAAKAGAGGGGGRATRCSTLSRDTASSRDGDEGGDQDASDADDDKAAAPQGSSSSSAATRRRGAAAISGSGGGAAAAASSSGSNSAWGTATCTGVGTDAAFGPSLPGLGAFGKGLGLFKGDDELNLAGLLNVLDGVVDTPDRIIIMTTNHPEKLDPALIRPGRINKKIYMGRLRVAEALSMLRHYFGPLAPADEAALRAVFVDEHLSPADLEAMCAEYDTLGELVESLAGRVAGREEGFRAC